MIEKKEADPKRLIQLLPILTHDVSKEWKPVLDGFVRLMVEISRDDPHAEKLMTAYLEFFKEPEEKPV